MRERDSVSVVGHKPLLFPCIGYKTPRAGDALTPLVTHQFWKPASMTI